MFINPHDQSASNNMHWSSGSGATSGTPGSSMAMVGLLAKAVPAAAPAVTAKSAADAAGSELLYAVEWQAHSTAGAAASARSSVAGPAAAAAVWSVGSGGGHLAVKLQQAAIPEGAFAAANLEVIQKVRAASPKLQAGSCTALWISTARTLRPR